MGDNLTALDAYREARKHETSGCDFELKRQVGYHFKTAAAGCAFAPLLLLEPTQRITRARRCTAQVPRTRDVEPRTGHG